MGALPGAGIRGLCFPPCFELSRDSSAVPVAGWDETKGRPPAGPWQAGKLVALPVLLFLVKGILWGLRVPCQRQAVPAWGMG